MLDDEYDDSYSDFDHENEFPAHLRCGLIRPYRNIYLGDEPIADSKTNFPTLTSALRSPEPPPSFVTPNKFGALTDSEDIAAEDEVGDMADEFNNWAHKVNKK